MIISYREKLIKLASNPNSFPWNVSPSSKAKPGERDMTSADDIINEEFVKMKVHDDNDMAVDKNHINWETINQLELPQFAEKEVKFTRSKK